MGAQPLARLAAKIGDQFFALRYRSQPRRHRPVLIVGCGHSGTSVLLAMLGAHSKLFAIPKETAFAADPQASAAKIRHRFDKLTIRARKLRWVEKTPSHIRHLDRVFALFPEARVLLIIRDGRDVACSVQDRTSNLEEGIQRWVQDNRAGELYWKDARVHVLRYEEMVEAREDVMRRVMAFLQEDFEEAVLRYHEKPNLFYAKIVERPESAFGENHDKYRNWQINQPFFDGRGKWQRLSPDEKALIKKVAGDLLIDYGYAADHNW